MATTQSYQVAATSVPLGGIGVYNTGQGALQPTGGYQLNATRQNSGKIWIHADADPAVQAQQRRMSSMKGSNLICSQYPSTYFQTSATRTEALTWPTAGGNWNLQYGVQGAMAWIGPSGAAPGGPGGTALQLTLPVSPIPSQAARYLGSNPATQVIVVGGMGAGGRGGNGSATGVAGQGGGAGGTGGAAVVIPAGQGQVLWSGNIQFWGGAGGGSGGAGISQTSPVPTPGAGGGGAAGGGYYFNGTNYWGNNGVGGTGVPSAAPNNGQPGSSGTGGLGGGPTVFKGGNGGYVGTTGAPQASRAATNGAGAFGADPGLFGPAGAVAPAAFIPG
jgi:hypothetical protein